MATYESFCRIRSILLDKFDRDVVVVSAPGKRFKTDIKVTDLLLKLAVSEKRNAKWFSDQQDINEIHYLINILLTRSWR
jgi:aspartokinase